MRGLNLDHLHTFALVAELGGFSAAADVLGLSQPAVSLQIRQLEQRLKVRLIERVGRRATPTAAGTELLDHARRIEDQLSALTDSMQRHSDGLTGRVRLGTGATFCIYLLPSVLQRLRQRLPGLDIMVRIGNTNDILKGIEDNVLDLGFVTLPVAGRMFDVTPVLEEEFLAVLPAGDDSIPEDITPVALSRQKLILYEPGSHTRTIIDRWFAAGGIAPRPVMELGSVEAIKEMVGAGMGCAVLPSMAVQPGIRQLAIVARHLTPPLFRGRGIVVRRDKIRHRGLREIVKALEESGGFSPAPFG
jgi:DNA-binding transcriptional LysR family regulator